MDQCYTNSKDHSDGSCEMCMETWLHTDWVQPAAMIHVISCQGYWSDNTSPLPSTPRRLCRCDTESWAGTIATDSLSVLQTLTGKGKVDKDDEISEEEVTVQDNENDDSDNGPVIFDVLKADWDVLIEIQTSQSKFSGIKLIHVERHQDREKDYDQLTNFAQMNVQADQLAGRYHRLYGKDQPLTPDMPQTCIQLDLPTGLVTRKITKSLRSSHGNKELMHYLCTKYGRLDEVDA